MLHECLASANADLRGKKIKTEPCGKVFLIFLLFIYTHTHPAPPFFFNYITLSLYSECDSGRSETCSINFWISQYNVVQVSLNATRYFAETLVELLMFVCCQQHFFCLTSLPTALYRTEIINASENLS